MNKMIRWFLAITNINKINLCVIGIEKHFIRSEIYLINLIYLHFIFNLSKRHFNIPGNVFYIKKLAISLFITLNKSMMT